VQTFRFAKDKVGFVMRRTIGILLTVFLLVFSSNALAVDLAGKFGFIGRLTMNKPILNFANEKKTGAQIGYGFGINGEYFVTNQIALGARFDYNSFRVKSNDADFEVHIRVDNFGAFVKYIIPSKTELHPYLKADLGLYKPGICAESNDYAERTSYSMRFGFALGGGVFQASNFYMLGMEVLFHDGFVKGAKTTYMGNEHNFGRDLEYIQLSVIVAFFIGGSRD
jgi:hypothetical protein